jgi:hypothetical protein
MDFGTPRDCGCRRGARRRAATRAAPPRRLPPPTRWNAHPNSTNDHRLRICASPGSRAKPDPDRPNGRSCGRVRTTRPAEVISRMRSTDRARVGSLAGPGETGVSCYCAGKFDSIAPEHSLSRPLPFGVPVGVARGSVLRRNLLSGYHKGQRDAEAQCQLRARHRNHAWQESIGRVLRARQVREGVLWRSLVVVAVSTAACRPTLARHAMQLVPASEQQPCRGTAFERP